MAWISPTGHVDHGVWANEIYVYNEDTLTGASTTVEAFSWSGYLELNHAALLCDKVRFWAKWRASDQNSIILQVHYDGGWHTIYTGAYASREWVEKVIPEGEKLVDAAQAKFYNPDDGYSSHFFYEFDFWGVPVGWTGKISGVTNPAKIMGVDVANIAKVKGVASA